MSKVMFLLGLGLFLLNSPASAMITSTRSGLQLVAESDVVVAINASEFSFINDGGSDWLVWDPKNPKVFKGDIEKKPIWIKSLSPGLYKAGSTNKLEGSPWLLCFLRSRSDGRFEYATDNPLQREIQLPQNVDPAKSDDFVDMLVQCLDEAKGREKDYYVWLLAGLPSFRAVSSLNSVSTSADMNLAIEAFVIRIRSGDMSAWMAAETLIKSDALKGRDRVTLETIFDMRRAFHERASRQDFLGKLGIYLKDAISTDLQSDVLPNSEMDPENRASRYPRRRVSSPIPTWFGKE